MKTTTRVILFNVLLVVVALAAAAAAFLTEIHREAESWALKEQDQHLKTFWRLFREKGSDFRVVDGRLMAGDYVVNGNYELPDNIRDIFGCTATIFMGDSRVSTNVLRADGSRAVGTRLQGPAYDAIFRQGRPYRGEASILGIPYFTAYDPIRNGRGETIGALYVGVKKSVYFATYERLKTKVVVMTALLAVLFSLLAFLLIRLRRKTDDALRESEEKYRRLFELNSDAVLLVDRETGRIMEANARALGLYGFARGEFLSANVADLSAEPEQTRDALDTGLGHIPTRWHRKKDGNVFPVEIFNSFFTWQERPVLIAAIRDITERKRAEEALRESEARLKIAMDLASLVQWEYDVETDTFVFDDEFYALYGTTTEREGGPIMPSRVYAERFLPPEEAPMVAAEISKALTSDDPDFTGRLEHRIIRADGEERFVSVRYRVVRDRTGRVVKTRGSNQDITERKRAEESLSRLNRTLIALTRCNETLVRAENESDLLHEICRIIVEDGGYRLAWVGYAEQDEARSIRPAAFAGNGEGLPQTFDFGWGDGERGRWPCGTAIRTGLPSCIRDMGREPLAAPWLDEAAGRSLGSWLAIPLISSEQTGALNVHASARDAFDEAEIELMVQLANDLAYGIRSLRIDEKHRQTTEALWESVEDHRRLAAARDKERSLLRALIDSIPDLIFFKDQAGVYLGCNKAFAGFAGRPEQDLVGHTDLDVFSPEVADFFREMDRQMMSQRTARRNEEWVDYPDGRRLLLDTLKTPFYDQEGNVLGLIGISRDITEHRLAEEERKRLEGQLHQSQKMEAVGQLAGGIAHDFNNILTAIIGYAEIMAMRLDKESPLRYHVERIFTSAERAAELTHSLLAFSRKQVMHKRPVDLCEVARGLKKMLGRLLPEDIDFRTAAADEELIVMADRGQIEQVFMNLVTNAKDAMPMGGLLSIDVSRSVMEGGFLHSHGRGEPGDYACVTVADTGHGMDEETRKRIFEPFFTTKEVGKGTGLGMAIIFGIVQQHNGYITVYSEPARGTTFRIYLPLIAGEKKEAFVAQEEEPPAGGSETVLLAEDDTTVRELHRMILEGAGYRVVEAVDGLDALERFRERPAEVDILITDVIMPKMDGKRLYEEIRGVRPDMRVLFMSGYTKDIVVERGIMEDESCFLTKPVMSSALLRRMRSLLDHDRSG